MNKEIVIYVVGPEGVGKSAMVKTFTKGKNFTKRVECAKCWATNVKNKESDEQGISIFEYRGFKGKISTGPALMFWRVHVLIVMCRQDTLSEACKYFKFDFWKNNNTQTYLVQNIDCSEIRNTTNLERVGTTFGFPNVYQLPVNVKGEVRRFFLSVIADVRKMHPDFRRDDPEVGPTTENVEDSGYETRSLVPKRHTSLKLLETYKMASESRGMCVIIDNEDFGDLMEKRLGSDKDRTKLEKLFLDLHFDVQVFKNQTRSDILTVLKTASMKNHSSFSCFVCCILSHGAQEIVHGTDGNAVDISQLITFFEGDQCAGLIGKPKMFFIQACQGGKRRTGVGIDHSTDFGAQPDANVCPTMPVEADFLMAFATTPGSSAYRDVNAGTPYITKFVDVLKHNLDKSLTDVLTAVNASMAEQDHTIDGQRVKQIGCFKSTLCKKIIFELGQN